MRLWALLGCPLLLELGQLLLLLLKLSLLPRPKLFVAATPGGAPVVVATLGVAVVGDTAAVATAAVVTIAVDHCLRRFPRRSCQTVYRS